MTHMIQKEDLFDAVICDEEESILEVSRILRDTMRRELIVLSKEKMPLGVISTIDINNRVVSEEKDPKNLSAKDIMTKNICVVELGETYDLAFEKLCELKTNSIPVVEKGKLCGLLSINNIWNAKMREENNES
ncbi:hypothetical protein H6501_03560 [Candidatus Woesearchaeota archaeon]|nr:hypothetical protein [Nanoarchaeota archaeon]MCB9370647.1 hypothetical protein [Candidatus Woesearchaeota archaeon]USN43731.1 MAG: hypothetical protein H6500_05060 [Candidatus Woesearchaeota archaeon]